MYAATVHVYVRLHERQPDARTADGTLRLVETLEEMRQLFRRNSLARVRYAQRVAVVVME